MNLATVADPFLVPLSKGVNVLGHPGSFVEVEFPFSYVGEMEGMITEANRANTPVRHVGLEILDSNGDRVKSTVGEFDGYYYFPDLFPGEYLLAVIPSTINTTRFEIPDPRPFTVPGAPLFTSSSCRIAFSICVRPWPPYSTGQDAPT